MNGSRNIDRRTFLSGSASMIAGGVAVTRSALSYSRILGANDRISLCHVGNGDRGRGHAWIVAQLAAAHNVEMTGVCDLWELKRETAIAANRKYYGRAPRAFRNIEEALSAENIDAVIISTPDHSHSPLLKMVAEAGKDAYVEKPMGNVLEEVKAARDMVVQNQRIVQVGTQHRSEPYPNAAHDLVQTGVLGEVSKVEIVWNYHGPRWRGRPETRLLHERDTDWKRFLLNKPDRPFDPQVYCEFRLYKEFSSGIPDQWMSHAIDLVHWFMNDSLPRSVVAHGGVFAWHDGRENPDTFQTLLEYPKGFLVSYSTSFGNDAPGFTRYMGKNATLVNIGGEGSPRYQLVEERGNLEEDPDIVGKRSSKYILLPGETKLPPMGVGDQSLEHMANWFECMRSRQQPHCTVQDGLAHSVACIMSARSYWSGRKQYWDAPTEMILDRAPSA